jgi:hypothetical protein
MRDRIISVNDQDGGGDGQTRPLGPDPLEVVGREAEATASAAPLPAPAAVGPVTPEVSPAVPGASDAVLPPPATGTLPDRPREEPSVDLATRRDELTARFAELQCDLGGLVYEMAIRDHIRVDVLVRRAAILQDVDAELGEVERILRMEQTGAAGVCASCQAPHSSGAVYCWQCGQPLLEHVPSHAIGS